MLLRLLRTHARPYLPWVVGVLVFQLISTIATLSLPSLNARIIDNGVTKGDTDYIWSTGAVMLAVALVQVVSAVVAVWCGARTAIGVGRDLRRSVFLRVGSFSAREVGSFGAPSLITRNTNDVQQIQMLTLMALNFMVMAPIMCVGGIIMALREDPGLSWLVWVSIPVMGVLLGLVVSRLMPWFRTMQERIDGINGVLREQITGIRVIRAFVKEPFETRRFARANQDITDISLKIGALFVLMFPVINMVMHLATAAVLWFGGQRVDQGQIEVGALTAFLQYMLQILMAVMMATFMFMMVPRAVVSAERITEVLDTHPAMHPPQRSAAAPRARGRLEFRDVTFQYPGAEAPVLDDICFTAEPGRTVAIVGATGSGKSTLINLIPRLIDPVGGEVLLDGLALPDYAPEDLAGRVGLVPQRPFLFSGTVASNLRFGREDATDEELWEALRVAQAEDFVRAMPQGLDAPMSQGGTNVSGGQRQRLSIARALVARPSVYVFDDSFSALDVATDARLRAALRPVTRDATVVTVAQRVSTITGADEILVLERGRITARGTHEELVASSTTYREIVTSQLSADQSTGGAL
ncbi:MULTISPECIES: ABC transporter ATP-binding protein [Kocuria]|uniref:ABC transporter ATP-binding protein n=1 Tax=Kocuria TaxID=57493 RepID=UPI0008A48205|nr:MULTISPECIES: ABC transporter ATP-binding protein [Kocuria]MCT1457869.1 ABC transporter ATP-binding protein/permease [Kocuria rhizophila]MCT1881218.1 ABC transporter ATP-binding protein/permease [Kocuria rhizophila]MCT1958519.1 ABC transporter ATP-binding protein/permease [Kocuria rhizophila]MCT2074500.1 ABC transporter ATP-binding protein/permease [Kocuria rhizophila]MDR7374636.1 ATP-binding cassette subfamily B protein [Kocuria rhizophila]